MYDNYVLKLTIVIGRFRCTCYENNQTSNILMYYNVWSLLLACTQDISGLEKISKECFVCKAHFSSMTN